MRIVQGGIGHQQAHAAEYGVRRDGYVLIALSFGRSYMPKSESGKKIPQPDVLGPRLLNSVRESAVLL